MNIWRLVSPEQFSEPALAAHHNHWLVLGAIFLAILAAWALFPVTERFHVAKGRARYLWLVAGSVAMGTGIWAMHFTAMLSYTLPIPIRYDMTITLLSMVPAIVATGSCILLSAPFQDSIKHLYLMALVMAAGIGSMHYTGMEAIVVSADMYYVPEYFLFSILAAYVLALAGLSTYKHLIKASKTSILTGKIFGSIALGLAVSCMHFLAMRATYFQSSIETLPMSQAMPSYNLIGGIATITTILLCMIIIGSIVDRRMHSMAQSLQKSELRFQRLAETTQTAIFTFKDERITYANPALSALTGHKKTLHSSIEKILSKEFNEYSKEVLNSHVPFGQAFYIAFEIQTADGEQRWLHFSLTVAEIDDEVTGLASACDISEQKKAEINMRQLAYSDQLTQIGSRMMFMDRLEHHLALLQRKSDQYTSFVMLLDLDSFKAVNDSFGHLKGDELLVKVASRLKKLSRNVDTIGRLGGDEFVLLLEEVNNSLSVSIIAGRLMTGLSKPYNLDGREVIINCSIGIVELNASYKKPDDILHDADIALYRAKKQPRSFWVLFNDELDAKVKRARQLQSELKEAIAQGKLQLYYQPIIRSNGYKLNGFEALARWQRDNGEWVSPIEFIPLAEESGMIADIGLWVLEAACAQLDRWNKNNKSDTDNLYVSINVASVSFNDDHFNQKVTEMFAHYKFKKQQLKLELTERMLVTDSDSMLDKLHHLIEIGCELMIDDFGTGYSSLSYLHRLPISTLKIDRSFVSNLDQSESSAPIVKTIIALAQSLDMRVISEGVETEEQSETLVKLGSDQLQGYLFSKPMPADKTEEFIAEKT